MTSAEQYASMLNSKFGGYRPVWYPSTKIAVGDILTLNDDGTFARWGSLATNKNTKAVAFSVLTGASIPIDFVSSAGMTFTAKLSGSTNANLPSIPQASVGLGIEFSNQGDFTMYADTATESYLADFIQMEADIKNLLKANKWDPRFIIAVKVMQVPSFTLLLSNTANSKIELTLEGTLTPSIRELGKVGVDITTTSSTGSYEKIIGAKDVTPLITGVRLTWHPLAGDRLEVV